MRIISHVVGSDKMLSSEDGIGYRGEYQRVITGVGYVSMFGAIFKIILILFMCVII